MIKIESMRLENFRGFTDTTIQFSKNVTCIAGVNGSGKSTVLDAMSIMLSRIVGAIDTTRNYAKELTNSDGKKGARDDTRIITQVNINETMTEIVIGLALGSHGKRINVFEPTGFQNIGIELSRCYPKNSSVSIPVFIYYPTNRSELDVDLSVEAEKDLSEMYLIYDNAFNSVIHFKEFFRWFRDREDRENEEQLEKYKSGSNEEIYEDIQLKAVRAAVKSFLEGYDNFKVVRKSQDLILNKKGVELSIKTLSDGEKGIIVLFGDIARRLAMANPNSENPLEGDGIILIDEIELHLHPEWQRKIVPALTKTFPNCQFIVTTHSPQVLGEIEPENIRLLDNFEVSTPKQSYGLDSNSVLVQLMNNDSKTPITINAEIDKKIHDISLLIDKDKFKEAKEQLKKLEERLHGSTPDTLELSTMIAMLEGGE